jgi:hypothetical protein
MRNCLFVVLLLIGLATQAHAAIVFDASSTASLSSASSTITFSHTVTSTANTELTVFVTTQTVYSVTGIKFNSVSLSQASSVNNNNVGLTGSLWTLANPSSGTHNIVITLSTSSSRTLVAGAEAMSFAGVGSTGNVVMATSTGPGSGTSTTSTLAITTTNGNTLADFATVNNGGVSTNITAKSAQTFVSSFVNADVDTSFGDAYVTATTTGTYTNKWNFTATGGGSDGWVAGDIELIPPAVVTTAVVSHNQVITFDW